LRVCYFGTYRAEYSRNRIMIDGLRCAGFDVVECHTELWYDVEDRIQVANGGWISPRFWWRALRAYGQLLRDYRLVGPYDVMVVGYPGQLDVFLARVLTWLAHKPLVWDIFMSIYLIAAERGLDRSSPVTVRLIRGLERLACRLPDQLILDTEDYVAWFGAIHGVSPDRFCLVPTGADNRVFVPDGSPAESPFHVLYYGTYIPNHGVPYIVEAARLLSDDPSFQFELVGRGPEREEAQAMAEHYGLTNITFLDWMDQAHLVQQAHRSNVCLGAFGTTPQSVMTVQNKIYEGLAMAKPVISGDSSAVRRTLQHGEHIYLCRRADPDALAAAIRTLRNDRELCARLGQNGFAWYREHFTIEQLGLQFKQHLLSIAGGNAK
jgi:glycosyltransferase involved in cell wall biosynthesis